MLHHRHCSSPRQHNSSATSDTSSILSWQGSLRRAAYPSPTATKRSTIPAGGAFQSTSSRNRPSGYYPDTPTCRDAAGDTARWRRSHAPSPCSCRRHQTPSLQRTQPKSLRGEGHHQFDHRHHHHDTLPSKRSNAFEQELTSRFTSRLKLNASEMLQAFRMDSHTDPVLKQLANDPQIQVWAPRRLMELVELRLSSAESQQLNAALVQLAAAQCEVDHLQEKINDLESSCDRRERSSSVPKNRSSRSGTPNTVCRGKLNNDSYRYNQLPRRVSPHPPARQKEEYHSSLDDSSCSTNCPPLAPKGKSSESLCLAHTNLCQRQEMNQLKATISELHEENSQLTTKIETLSDVLQQTAHKGGQFEEKQSAIVSLPSTLLSVARRIVADLQSAGESLLVKQEASLETLQAICLEGVAGIQRLETELLVAEGFASTVLPKSSNSHFYTSLCEKIQDGFAHLVRGISLLGRLAEANDQLEEELRNSKAQLEDVQAQHQQESVLEKLEHQRSLNEIHAQLHEELEHSQARLRESQEQLLESQQEYAAAQNEVLGLKREVDLCRLQLDVLQPDEPKATLEHQQIGIQTCEEIFNERKQVLLNAEKPIQASICVEANLSPSRNGTDAAVNCCSLSRSVSTETFSSPSRSVSTATTAPHQIIVCHSGVSTDVVSSATKATETEPVDYHSFSEKNAAIEEEYLQLDTLTAIDGDQLVKRVLDQMPVLLRSTMAAEFQNLKSSFDTFNKFRCDEFVSKTEAALQSTLATYSEQQHQISLVNQYTPVKPDVNPEELSSISATYSAIVEVEEKVKTVGQLLTKQQDILESMSRMQQLSQKVSTDEPREENISSVTDTTAIQEAVTAAMQTQVASAFSEIKTLMSDLYQVQPKQIALPEFPVHAMVESVVEQITGLLDAKVVPASEHLQQQENEVHATVSTLLCELQERLNAHLGSLNSALQRVEEKKRLEALESIEQEKEMLLMNETIRQEKEDHKMHRLVQALRGEFENAIHSAADIQYTAAEVWSSAFAAVCTQRNLAVEDSVLSRSRIQFLEVKLSEHEERETEWSNRVDSAEKILEEVKSVLRHTPNQEQDLIVESELAQDIAFRLQLCRAEVCEVKRSNEKLSELVTASVQRLEEREFLLASSPFTEDVVETHNNEMKALIAQTIQSSLASYAVQATTNLAVCRRIQLDDSESRQRNLKAKTSPSPAWIEEEEECAAEETAEPPPISLENCEPDIAAADFQSKQAVEARKYSLVLQQHEKAFAEQCAEQIASLTGMVREIQAVASEVRAQREEHQLRDRSIVKIPPRVLFECTEAEVQTEENELDLKLFCSVYNSMTTNLDVMNEGEGKETRAARPLSTCCSEAQTEETTGTFDVVAALAKEKNWEEQIVAAVERAERYKSKYQASLAAHLAEREQLHEQLHIVTLEVQNLTSQVEHLKDQLARVQIGHEEEVNTVRGRLQVSQQRLAAQEKKNAALHERLVELQVTLGTNALDPLQVMEGGTKPKTSKVNEWKHRQPSILPGAAFAALNRSHSQPPAQSPTTPSDVLRAVVEERKAASRSSSEAHNNSVAYLAVSHGIERTRPHQDQPKSPSTLLKELVTREKK